MPTRSGKEAGTKNEIKTELKADLSTNNSALKRSLANVP